MAEIVHSGNSVKFIEQQLDEVRVEISGAYVRATPSAQCKAFHRMLMAAARGE